MSRTLLHLLLVFGLVLNAVAAPWGEAHAHARHASPAAHGDGANADAAALPDLPAHHHGMRHHGTSMPDVQPDAAPHAHHAADTAASHDACCGGLACQCGCVLPPAVPGCAGCALRLPGHADLVAGAVILAVERRDSPPFRPPA
ncbi:CopL family metal-binding regulatory protein [Chiayiivirga flava]|uniref:CopL family metal-binding regulatory protein n=1 Tax=Chiayiivirga flava TaxID=659595 RepID=A0A7W8G1U6_9GAMM|nr:CopL family metal-binding regulatory protein [Chiayiivirga flava]MBB5209769.1 hypothetical protein [Chiayiivirga flava]